MPENSTQMIIIYSSHHALKFIGRCLDAIADIQHILKLKMVVMQFYKCIADVLQKYFWTSVTKINEMRQFLLHVELLKM